MAFPATNLQRFGFARRFKSTAHGAGPEMNDAGERAFLQSFLPKLNVGLFEVSIGFNPMGQQLVIGQTHPDPFFFGLRCLFYVLQNIWRWFFEPFQNGDFGGFVLILGVPAHLNLGDGLGPFHQFLGRQLWAGLKGQRGQ